MKSVILTAQEARELDKLGGLTITKPIRPAPPPYVEGARLAAYGPGEWLLIGPDGDRVTAEKYKNTYTPPVQTEDAVFIREPWYRLKDPRGGESERVILAADSVVSEEQVSYKWSSPVSMPEAAARRFARVKSIGAAYGENVSPVWLIELEAVDKAAAVAADAGTPFSSASAPEEGSTYLTYAGDMSAEDRERMVAAINADRASLAEVQDRLIRIDLRRRELSSLMFEERDKVDPNDRDALKEENTTLDEEQGNLAREEADLRAALESAGAPAPTVEDHAREKLNNVTAVLSGPSEEIPTLSALATLKEEERELTAYLAAIDTAETPEGSEGGAFRP